MIKSPISQRVEKDRHHKYSKVKDEDTNIEGIKALVEPAPLNLVKDAANEQQFLASAPVDELQRDSEQGPVETAPTDRIRHEENKAKDLETEVEVVTASDKVDATASGKVDSTHASEKVDATASEKVDATPSEKVDATASEKVDATPSEKVDATVSDKVAATHATQKVDVIATHATQKIDATASEKVDATASEEVDATASEKVDATASDKVDATASEKVDTTASEKVDVIASEKVDATHADKDNNNCIAISGRSVREIVADIETATTSNICPRDESMCPPAKRLKRLDSGYQSNASQSSDSINSTDCSQKTDPEHLQGVNEVTPRDTEIVDDIANYINQARIVDETAKHQQEPEASERRIGEEVKKRLFMEPTPLQSSAIKFAKKRRVSKSQKSGIIFPVARIHNKLRKGRYARSIGVGAAVYLAAVMEYLSAEVLELAGNFTQYYNRVRITPRSILLTLKNDAELDQLTPTVIIPQGGVRPNINPALLPPETISCKLGPGPNSAGDFL